MASLNNISTAYKNINPRGTTSRVRGHNKRGNEYPANITLVV
ncbi:MAG TPA: hypothetical protein VFL70_02005 [Bacteroidia bacterium]|nr:hypothetical protein [Bacteroidia bacterium]